MVRNWIKSRHERIQYISPDGKTYNLHDPTLKSVIIMSGWGLPPAEIAETKGPFQHGTDPLTIRLPKREIRTIIRHNGCNRVDYWENRIGLVDALRLNRTSVNNPSPGHLKWYRADGKVRQVDVFVTEGPDFGQSSQGWDEFSYQDELVFSAFNPIIYDPKQQSQSFSDLGCTILESLQFDVTFNSDFIFAANTCNDITAITVNYLGNWQEYPTIELYGPATNFSITHDQLGLKLELENITIAAGDKVTFDLRYGRKLVTLLSTGASLLGYISEDSDLGSFAIEPDPVVANGQNSFTVSIDNGDGNTLLVFKYYNRYVGI